MQYEKSIKELEGIVAKLEGGNLGLTQSLELFERGVSLAALCNKELDLAKQRIEVVFESSGEVIETSEDKLEEVVTNEQQ